MDYTILNRIAFSPNASSLRELKKLGLEAFVEKQLSPTKENNQTYQEKKDAFKFNSNEPSLKGRGFHYLEASISELWEITKNERTFEQKKMIPAAEVIADTCLRAVYSDWQLREILVHFWHNHFNVSIEADEKIILTLPIYDQEVIQKHCLGNFRVFLEAVATSQSMLFYLDNASSRASPANENYARELFELHTLGASNYLNHLYNRWREVPGAETGKAEGYIDEDIYEAARAFTGWTVADGEWTDDGKKPNTGEFLYLEKWHDNYQKRIMGVEFSSNQAPMADGKKVLDLLAAHKGTARFLCTKLCVRFISDDPPSSIIDKAVKVWIEQQDAPDQIKQVVKTILLSDEFTTSLGSKVKNPFELFISMIRVLDLDFSPNINIQWLLRQMGYRLFSWPTPTGHPDKATYWLNSSMMLKRWNIMPSILFDNWHKMTNFKAKTLTIDKTQSSQELILYWLEKILGKQPSFSKAHQQKLVEVLLIEGKTASDPPYFWNEEDKFWRMAQVISLILMSPQFQYR